VSFARSLDVDLYQITFTKDSSRPFIVELGTKARCLQFIDLNREEQVFKLPYAKQLTTCDDALRQLKFLINEGKKLKIDFKPPSDLESFSQTLK
jgi:hypothetical protein